MARAAVRRALLKAQLAVREVVALSPRTMRAIVANSFLMTLRGTQWRRRHGVAEHLVDAGSCTGAASTDGDVGVAVTYERATLHVRALSDAVVRLAWGPAPAPFDIATRDADLVAPSAVTVDLHRRGATLATALLRVEVDDDGVVVSDVHGQVRYVERTPLVRGERRILRRVLRDGERLCGLGEQARGLDLTGATYRLWNRDPGGSWGTGQDPLYCSVPVTVGLHHTGPVWAFHENTYEAEITVGRVEHAAHGVTAEFHGGALITYVAVGELDELLTAAASLTGRPSMPPRWALGYHHSRWGWRTDTAVGEVLDGFATRRLPVSALHLDIDHMDHFRVFTVDPERFGGIDALARRAADAGVRLVAIVDPAVRRDTSFPLYAEGVRGGHFVSDEHGRIVHGTVWPGWAAFPDFTSDATRSWWGSHYAALTSLGIAGVWHDMNEPTSITLWGDRTLPRSAVHDLGGRGGLHDEAHNVYGLLMNKAGHDALAAADGSRRPFVLSRAGWTGLARYARHWTADVEATKEGLAQQVATFLGLGLSSIPFTGSDIGGFSGIPSPELYVRWLELGVVSPFCRTHCVIGAPDREPWQFEAPVEAAIGRLMRLRPRLLPPLYRLAEEAHRLGHPMLRPTDWPVGASPTGVTASTEASLLGDELLVVPVSDPDATTVTVALPAGMWRRLRVCEPVEGTHGGGAVVVGGRGGGLDGAPGQP